MKLKTATLIAIFGVAIHFLIVVGIQVYHIYQFRQFYQWCDFSVTLVLLLNIVGSVLLDGSLILFLLVFYKKQCSQEKLTDLNTDNQKIECNPPTF